MIQYADPKRQAPPAYAIGDPVMLFTRNLQIKRPCKKLDHKYLGPFQIEKVISPMAARLTLPQIWKCHPTFHVSELEPFECGSRPPPDYTKTLRKMSDIEADEEYDVDTIMGSITRRKKVHYHVKWHGYPKKKDWIFEPFENFGEGAHDKLQLYHAQHPLAPKDYRLQ